MEEEYEQYLRKFRRRQNSADRKKSMSPFRGSTFGGSSQGTRQNNATPLHMLGSQRT